MKLLLIDVGIVFVSILIMYIITKTDKGDGRGIPYLWIGGILLVIPLTITIVDLILYPIFYGFQDYYLVAIPLIPTVAFGLHTFFDKHLSIRNYQKYNLPARNFAFSLLREKGLGQQNTGKVYFSKVKGYKGQPKGELNIQLVKDEKELLEQEKESILQEFNEQYPFVKLNILCNDAITLKNILEDRKRSNKVISIS